MQTVYVERDYRGIVNIEVLNNNLGQNIAVKFTKISKTGFCMESITGDFSQLPCKTVKICLSGFPKGIRLQFLEIF